MGGLGRLFAITLFLFFCASAGGQTADPPPKKLSPERAEAKTLGEQLNSTDKAAQDKALARIKQLLDTTGRDGLGGKRHGQVYVEMAWVTSLQKAERHDDAESLALRGILLRPDGPYVPQFQRARTESLLAMGKHEQALAAAKGYYNVCLMKDTSRAIDLVSKCLVVAKPDDKTIGRRFNQQQVALSATPGAQPPAGSEGAPGEENILKAVKVDAKPFEDTIKATTGNEFILQFGRGNLLLLADKGGEAKACFELALQLAQGGKETTQATEGVARAIRAESASIGPANAYIVAQQSK